METSSSGFLFSLIFGILYVPLRDVFIFVFDITLVSPWSIECIEVKPSTLRSRAAKSTSGYLILCYNNMLYLIGGFYSILPAVGIYSSN